MRYHSFQIEIFHPRRGRLCGRHAALNSLALFLRYSLYSNTNIYVGQQARAVRLDGRVPDIKVVQFDAVCVRNGPAPVAGFHKVKLFAPVDHAFLDGRRRWDATAGRRAGTHLADGRRKGTAAAVAVAVVIVVCWRRQAVGVGRNAVVRAQRHAGTVTFDGRVHRVELVDVQVGRQQHRLARVERLGLEPLRAVFDLSRRPWARRCRGGWCGWSYRRLSVSLGVMSPLQVVTPLSIPLSPGSLLTRRRGTELNAVRATWGDRAGICVIRYARHGWFLAERRIPKYEVLLIVNIGTYGVRQVVDLMSVSASRVENAPPQ